MCVFFFNVRDCGILIEYCFFNILKMTPPTKKKKKKKTK